MKYKYYNTCFGLTLAGLLIAAPLYAAGKDKKKKKNAPDTIFVEKPVTVTRIVEVPASPSPFMQVVIPESIDFCGTRIDLSRFDRRERMDRELLSMHFMHSTSISMIKRANRYFPVVAPILKEEGVPADMIYLMVIESNVLPTARSGVGAAGLWQFMPTTAKDFGLVVNSEVDERLDVEKSTRAACRYLKQAYQRFGNWETVAASYNAGQGRISQFMSRQYQSNALDLYMTEETTRYIYRILAAKMLFENPKTFGFWLRKEDLYAPVQSQTVEVNTSVSSWAAFAKEHGITYAILRNANPWIVDSTLTNRSGQTYRIAIPTQEWMHASPASISVYNKAWVSE